MVTQELRTGRATARQREVLAFIVERLRQDGRPPTMREICTHFGWGSTNAAYQHLCALRNKGLLTHTPRSNRGWLPSELVGVWLSSRTAEHGEAARLLRAGWDSLSWQDLLTVGALASAAALRRKEPSP